MDTAWLILAAVLAGAGTVLGAVSRSWAVALVGGGVLSLVLPRLL